ncbi:MAG TPA: hypothetical protein VFA00_05170 [Actinomycetota bacterium]|nr:hypothetical protein [Actinomycetota bacterium]
MIVASSESLIIETVKVKGISLLASKLDEASGRSLAHILRREGVDLSARDSDPLPPGTPVYIKSEADLTNLQVSLTKANCRVIPVLNGESLVGFIETGSAEDRA